jgi:UDP-sulfoquinovose synthase
MEKIFVLGGDGFCGWPSALHLSQSGYEVVIIDNLSRRKIDVELGVQSLTPIQTIEKRLAAWNTNQDNKIRFIHCDIAKEYHKFEQLLIQERPSTIVHFAEQRAAPYSMKNEATRRYTVSNNIDATNNVLVAITNNQLDIHLVHLGTMGVYGYSSAGLKIPEGYLDVKIELPDSSLIDETILYPTNPGSIYHMTKSMDQIMFAFYAKNYRVRITDLHQGIVWGTDTVETSNDINLINRFDYDGDYGTVLNRFITQAALRYPLTVHGTGGQTRAFIHINDTVRCIRLACENPPEAGERVQIRNQVTETHRVRDLAKLISDKTGAEVAMLDNPRKEAAENDLDVSNASFLSLGLNPITLDTGLIDDVYKIAIQYRDRVDRNLIPCISKW